MSSDIEFEKLCRRFLQIVENGVGLPGGGIAIGPKNDPIYIQDLGIDANEFIKILNHVREKNYVEGPAFNSDGLIPSPSGSDVSEIIRITELGKNFLNS